MVNLNKETFFESISTKSFPEAIQQDSFQQILKKYPAFNSAYLLEAVWLNENEKSVFEKKITHTAIHVRDRGLLHDYVFNTKFEQKEAKNTLVEKNKIAAEKLAAAKEIERIANEEKEALQKQAIANEKNKQEAQKIIDKAAAKQKEQKQAAIKEAKAEKEIQEQAAKVAQEKKLAEEKAAQEAKTKQEQIAQDLAQKAKEAQAQKQEVQAILEKAETLKEEKKVLKPSSNFVKWLKMKEISDTGTEKVATLKEKTEAEEIKTEAAEDLIPFDRISTIEAEMQQEMKQAEDPLDSFISSEILRKQKRRKVPKKETNGSETEKKGEIVSETLAEILSIQQKYSEAIDVYKLLSMKYPQKSIYFANQIEKIKNYL